jgi:hypothetical protein
MSSRPIFAATSREPPPISLHVLSVAVPYRLTFYSTLGLLETYTGQSVVELYSRTCAPIQIALWNRPSSPSPDHPGPLAYSDSGLDMEKVPYTLFFMGRKEQIRWNSLDLRLSGEPSVDQEIWTKLKGRVPFLTALSITGGSYLSWETLESAGSVVKDDSKGLRQLTSLRLGQIDDFSKLKLS